MFYGISSFVYQQAKPFHPKRFLDYVSQRFPETIIRSKGIFWIASRPDQAILWSQAGGSIKAEVYGRWWASVPMKQRAMSESYIENQDAIQKKWDKLWGDRMNEIVFIGQEMNKETITKELDACLVEDYEVAEMQSGNQFEDDWPL